MMRTQLVQSIRKRLGIDSLRDERGVTLTEVVIVTAILSIVMTFVTAGFVSMQSAATTDDIKLQNLDEARQLMDNMTRTSARRRCCRCRARPRPSPRPT